MRQLRLGIRLDGDDFGVMLIPGLLCQNVFYSLSWSGANDARVLVAGRGYKMLRKDTLGLQCFANGSPAGAHVPGDGDGGEQECEKAESRDGKEDVHAP